jgi:hypothetical protein
MKVRNIEWLSKNAKEAEVTISDGHYECICFCHPCLLSLGEVISSPLIAFDTEQVIKIDDKAIPSITNTKNISEYAITGRLVGLKPNIVEIGNIVIDIGNYIPKDLHIGNLISFRCSRLDI